MNLENERLEKCISFPYVLRTSRYLSLCRFAPKNNLLAVYLSMLAIGKLLFVFVLSTVHSIELASLRSESFICFFPRVQCFLLAIYFLS